MHLCVMALRRKPSGTLHTEFMNSVASRLGAEKVVDFVRDNGDYFEQLLRSQLVATESSEALAKRARRVLRWLNAVDNVDWFPSALSMCRRIKSAQELVEHLEALERLVAFQFVTRANVTARVARQGKVLEWLTQKTPTENPVNLTQEERQRFRDGLDGDIYSTAKTRLYILRRLDEAVGDGGSIYVGANPTVEHVLPQNPKPGSQWSSWFSSEEAAHWTHRLANLVLLTRAKNSEASNYDFEQKKKKYFESPHGVSTFGLTTQVLQAKEWTPALLSRRQRELTSHLAREWRLVGDI
jgi:hypothetical protein